MGIQIFVTKEDLKAAGCTLDVVQVLPSDGPYPAIYACTVGFAGGAKFNFHDAGSRVWIDANHWGNNRGVVIPLLDAQGVAFREM